WRDLAREAPSPPRHRRTALRQAREAILILPRHVKIGRDVLRGLAHRVPAILLAHARVHEPPADARIEELRVARKGFAALREHVRRPRHALNAPGDVDVAVAEL